VQQWGDRIATTAHYSPRVGFNYDLNGDRVTQFRGGLGIFTSRPLVWPGGAYNNNGVSQGAIDTVREHPFQSRYKCRKPT
jgi:hypothetical protein